jgi:hypothetical protein
MDFRAKNLETLRVNELCRAVIVAKPPDEAGPDTALIPPLVRVFRVVCRVGGVIAHSTHRKLACGGGTQKFDLGGGQIAKVLLGKSPEVGRFRSVALRVQAGSPSLCYI